MKLFRSYHPGAPSVYSLSFPENSAQPVPAPLVSHYDRTLDGVQNQIDTSRRRCCTGYQIVFHCIPVNQPRTYNKTLGSLIQLRESMGSYEYSTLHVSHLGGAWIPGQANIKSGQAPRESQAEISLTPYNLPAYAAPGCIRITDSEGMLSATNTRTSSEKHEWGQKNRWPTRDIKRSHSLRSKTPTSYTSILTRNCRA